jgi:hypothetical protein
MDEYSTHVQSGVRGFFVIIKLHARRSQACGTLHSRGRSTALCCDTTDPLSVSDWVLRSWSAVPVQMIRWLYCTLHRHVLSAPKRVMTWEGASHHRKRWGVWTRCLWFPPRSTHRAGKTAAACPPRQSYPARAGNASWLPWKRERETAMFTGVLSARGVRRE